MNTSGALAAALCLAAATSAEAEIKIGSTLSITGPASFIGDPEAKTLDLLVEAVNRARALDNNFYVVAPNVGGYHLNVGDPTAIDAGSGRSMIVDYMGGIVGRRFDTNGSTRVTGVVNVEAQRHHRTHAKVANWLKDVRTEIAELIYQQPIYPKIRFAETVPGEASDDRQRLIADQIDHLVERDIWRRPSG